MRWWRKNCRYLLTLGISVMAVGSVQIVSAAPLDIAGQAAAITAQIQQVKIPERSYDVQSFGAVADGRTDSRNAINQAIAAASKAGGGKVVVPAGHYFVAGPIVLLSNVELHMEDHAEVKFSDRPQDYASPLVLTRFECTEVYNYSPLIYERNPVTDFTLQNCRIQHADKSGGTYNKYENTPPENITVENVIVNGKVYNGNGNF